MHSVALYDAFVYKVNTVAKPARYLVMELQILNDYHYSFLYLEIHCFCSL